jgi:hypothetical protein
MNVGEKSERGDGLGRPSRRSSLVSDPGAKFSVKKIRQAQNPEKNRKPAREVEKQLD